MRFEKGFNTNHPGEVGQWQNGVFEVIDPDKRRTAKPIYPKPEWPKKNKIDWVKGAEMGCLNFIHCSADP